jgi:hypothetical protein
VGLWGLKIMLIAVLQNEEFRPERIQSSWLACGDNVALRGPFHSSTLHESQAVGFLRSPDKRKPVYQKIGRFCFVDPRRVAHNSRFARSRARLAIVPFRLWRILTIRSGLRLSTKAKQLAFFGRQINENPSIKR